MRTEGHSLLDASFICTKERRMAAQAEFAEEKIPFALHNNC